MSQEAELSYLTMSEALQDIFVRQRTGALTMVTPDGRQTFYFLAGQLYLSGSNPERERLRRILEEPPVREEDPHFDALAYLERELGALVRDLVDIFASWKVGELRFIPGLGDVPDDISGPVPTPPLVMDLYSRGWTPEELLRRLGGTKSRFRASSDERSLRRVPLLDSGERALIKRLETGATVESLLEGGSSVSTVVCQLIRLTAVGLVELEADPAQGASDVSREVQASIAERVRRDLEMRPLEIDPSVHRKRVRRLLQDYGRLGYYDLLGLAGDASGEEVHGAFMDLARLAHPSHAEALGFSGAPRKLEWLLSRLIEAYLVLSDPDRAAEYRRTGSVAPSRSVEEDTGRRDSERAELARESYSAALDNVEEEEFFYAIELLQRAVLLDPQLKYYILLGRCQMRNPQWLHMAVDSFRQALSLAPDDEEARGELAEATRLYREFQKASRARAATREPAENAESRDDARARRLLSKLRSEQD